MGMPVILEIIDETASKKDFEEIFEFLTYVDEKFSTYKDTSEISRINRGELEPKEYSDDMKLIFELAEQTKNETDGFFDVGEAGNCDPSGIVKGWAINEAAKKLNKKFKNYYLEIAGDIQVNGRNKNNEKWRIGILNPLTKKELVKIIGLENQGIATSGNYERGTHIYNPKNKNKLVDGIASISVIGPNIYAADRFATAAFAMEKDGINFIEKQNGLEGYMIDNNGIATMTSGWERYVV